MTVPIGMKSSENLCEEEKQVAMDIAKGWSVSITERVEIFHNMKAKFEQEKLEPTINQDLMELVDELLCLPLPTDELDTAGDRVEELLLSEGGEQVFRTVWWRKPLASGGM